MNIHINICYRHYTKATLYSYHSSASVIVRIENKRLLILEYDNYSMLQTSIRQLYPEWTI